MCEIKDSGTKQTQLIDSNYKTHAESVSRAVEESEMDKKSQSRDQYQYL